MSDFEAFWRVYPRRVAKIKARTAYDKAINKHGATHEQILAGAIRYARERLGEDPQFTKHPATWLNGGCWEDESGHQEPADLVIAPAGALPDAELRKLYEQPIANPTRTSNIVELRPKSSQIRQGLRPQDVPDDPPWDR